MSNELVTIRKIEQAKLALMEVKSLSEISQIIDQAAAIKAYIKSAKLSVELQIAASEIDMRAKRRLGEISAAMPKAKGNQYQVQSPQNGLSKNETLAEMGRTKQEASEAQKLAKIPERIFEERIAQAVADSKKITKALFKDIDTTPEKQSKKTAIVSWNTVYQSRESYADNDPAIVELFEEMNGLKNDNERVEYMKNNIEFFQGAIRAFKRTMTEMGLA